MQISYRTSIVILAIIFSPLWLPLALRIVFYVDTSGRYVAEQIVLNRRPVSHCNRILVMPWNVLSPGTNDQRRTCIHEYAKLMKDPSACELLMPSSYGLSCVGGAITSRKMCTLSESAVSWWEDEEKEIVGRVSFESCQGNYPVASTKRNQCCLIARVTRVKGQDDCSPLANDTALHDECLSGLAFKNRNAESCIEIQDKNLQSACLIELKALDADPSLCDTCRKPVNSLSELK